MNYFHRFLLMVISQSSSLHLFEPVRRVCQKKLLKDLAKKRQMDSEVPTTTTIAKKHKMHVEETQESTDKASEREELDERTTQILEEELQAVMIKVWQALPDSPPSPAEKYVTETLRNDASDDIRNVLGLNVTKRLLNVFNPLNIRMMFSAVPKAHDLRRFEKDHNLSELAPMSKGRHVYSARVDHVADFDRLCSEEALPCGDVSVKVLPKYRFYDCPMTLNTGFIKKIKTAKAKKSEDCTDVETEATGKKSTETTSNEKIVQQATTNSEKKNESENSKITAKSNINKVKSSEYNQNKVEQNAKNIEVSNSEKKNNLTHNKVADPKPNVVKETHTVVQATAPKPKPKQVIQEATTVKNVTVEKTSISASASKPKPNQTSQEVVATKNVTEETPKATAKTTTTAKPKPNQINKEVVATKKVTDSTPKLVEKTSAATNPGKKPEPAPKSTVKSDEKPNVTKPKPNQVNKEVVVPRKVADSKPKLSIKNVEMINSEIINQEDEMNDDEEMNDEEILALISSGVVVDECSGSDDE